jgi:hypothetical protein
VRTSEGAGEVDDEDIAERSTPGGHGVTDQSAPRLPERREVRPRAMT